MFKGFNRWGVLSIVWKAVPKGEMSYSIVGILQGLSEGSSRYASYIDLYYQQLVVQVRRGIQVPKN